MTNGFDSLHQVMGIIRLLKQCCFVGCLSASLLALAQAPAARHLESLWSDRIEPLLSEPLWREETAYNAGHYLMVPLHAAFMLGNVEWQESFHRHYEQMLAARDELPEGLLHRLIRLQYLYSASRYLALAGKSAPRELETFLLGEIRHYWTQEPAWQWGRKPFQGGMRDRIAWKLHTRDVKKSYYRAIIDEEMFLIGIAADVGQYYRHQHHRIPKIVLEIMGVAERIFHQEVSWQPQGGWLFQPGVWTDHPDYSRAGHNELLPRLNPAPVPGIATDTSHSHRLPLWLLSLQCFYAAGSKNYVFYHKLRKGLAEQFFEVVVVPPDGKYPFYRTVNFMDGRNGVYRYRFSEKMHASGYGPYALSGTPLIGWWAFLPDRRAVAYYRNLSSNFQKMLDWLTRADPYNENAWMYQKYYPRVLPALPQLATAIAASTISDGMPTERGVNKTQPASKNIKMTDLCNLEGVHLRKAVSE